MALQRPYLRRASSNTCGKTSGDGGGRARRPGLAPRCQRRRDLLVAAFRGMLIDLAASPEDRDGRLADGMEVFIDVVGAMGAARAAAGAAPAGPKPSAARKPKARRAGPARRVESHGCIRRRGTAPSEPSWDIATIVVVAFALRWLSPWNGHDVRAKFPST